MNDRLLERCAVEFERGIERYAEMLFANCDGVNAFAACLREHPAGYMRLLDLAERAKRAVFWFARHAPCRYQPLPLVHYDEQENILCSGDLHRHLTVYFLLVARTGVRLLEAPWLLRIRPRPAG